MEDQSSRFSLASILPFPSAARGAPPTRLREIGFCLLAVCCGLVWLCRNSHNLNPCARATPATIPSHFALQLYCTIPCQFLSCNCNCAPSLFQVLRFTPQASHSHNHGLTRSEWKELRRVTNISRAVHHSLTSCTVLVIPFTNATPH